jgi:dCTP deaminase
MKPVMDRLSLLSDKAILHAMESGKVFISPFKQDNLSTSSYDVTLGPFYFREVKIECLNILNFL